MTMDKDEEHVADIVIVGSGAGSVCAALVAQEVGKTAIILEKQARFGGSTAHSGGVLWMPNNPLMVRDGIEDSFERARAYMDAAIPYTGPGSSPARRDAYVRSAPQVAHFLEAHGMRFRRPEGYADYYDELLGGERRSRSLMAEVFDINRLGTWKDRLSLYPGSPVRLRMDEINDLLLVKRTWKGKLAALRLALRLAVQSLRGQDLRGMGAAFQARMLEMALRANIPIWLDSPVSRLIEQDGRVIGAVVERYGRCVSIRARNAVLLNVGGFARNVEMRALLGPHPRALAWTAANPGDTGEVIQFAQQRFAAATDCMDEAWWTLVSLAPNPDPSRTDPIFMGHHWDISLPHSIVVDSEGRRFANEACSYMEVVQRLYERHRETQRAIPAWGILDRRHRERYPWGVTLGATPKRWLNEGYMKVANSIDDLAQQCGLPPTQLRETIDRFNGFCSDGVDRDFGRGNRAFDRYHGDPTVQPNPNLGAIEQPPYYAVAMYPGDVGTAGGLVTDEHARVLRADGTPIAGLYATGNSTASVFGRSHPGAGVSIGASLVFAYRAATHAFPRNGDPASVSAANQTRLRPARVEKQA